MKNFFLVSSFIVILSSCAGFPYPVPEPDSKTAVKSRNAEQIGIDSDLESRIDTAIRNVFPNDDYEISIEVFNKQVFLIGAVYKEDLINQMYKFVVANFVDADEVLNLLYYRANEDGWMGFYDFDLSNKIFATLVSTRKIESDTVDYLVFDRRVYVFGYATKRQVDTFVAMVSRIEGVKKIVVLVDYVEGDQALKPYEEITPTEQQELPAKPDDTAPEQKQEPVKAVPPTSQKETQEITPDIQKIDENKKGDPAKQTMPDEGDVMFR